MTGLEKKALTTVHEQLGKVDLYPAAHATREELEQWFKNSPSLKDVPKDVQERIIKEVHQRVTTCNSEVSRQLQEARSWLKLLIDEK